jgi:cytochrome c biogenesis protein CcmG/thiol:disulfide interchange protein DsbE
VTDVDVAEEDARPRRSLPIVVAVIAVVAVVGGLILILGTSEPAANRVAESPLVGELAPPIVGVTLSGEEFDLAEERGRWVLVNFFAQWCVPCQQEHDDLVAFDERHRAIGDAGVVSVVFDDDVDDVRAFFEANGGTFPVITSDEGDITLDYGVAKVPESYLIDPAGTVVAKIIGGVTEEGLEDLLQRFVGPG